MPWKIFKDFLSSSSHRSFLLFFRVFCFCHLSLWWLSVIFLIFWYFIHSCSPYNRKKIGPKFAAAAGMQPEMVFARRQIARVKEIRNFQSTKFARNFGFSSLRSALARATITINRLIWIEKFSESFILLSPWRHPEIFNSIPFNGHNEVELISFFFEERQESLHNVDDD